MTHTPPIFLELGKAVMVMFFLIFSGMIVWVYGRANAGLEDERFLPLEDSDGRE